LICCRLSARDLYPDNTLRVWHRVRVPSPPLAQSNHSFQITCGQEELALLDRRLQNGDLFFSFRSDR
jgi:hypothetical protein